MSTTTSTTLSTTIPSTITSTTGSTTTSTFAKTSPIDYSENYIYEEESKHHTLVPAHITPVSRVSIQQIFSKWLLSLRSKRDAANMIFPNWNSDLQNELENIPRCDLRVP